MIRFSWSGGQAEAHERGDGIIIPVVEISTILEVGEAQIPGKHILWRSREVWTCVEPIVFIPVS